MPEVAIFYNYAGDPRSLRKSMTAVYQTATIKPLEPLDDLRARLVIDYAAAVDSCNYFRYAGKLYHIESRERLTGGAMSVTGIVDAKTTYAEAVAACPAIASRNASQYDSAFNDNRYPTIQRHRIETHYIDSLPNDDVIIFAFVE